jgi:hypothetical protein
LIVSERLQWRTLHDEARATVACNTPSVGAEGFSFQKVANESTKFIAASITGIAQSDFTSRHLVV